MNEQKLTRRRAARPEAADDRTAAPEAAVAAPSAPSEAGCNLPACPRTPEWRGLCAAHRQTHRGLADPEESQ